MSGDLLRAECLNPALEENFADDPYETARFVITNMLTRCMDAAASVSREEQLASLAKALLDDGEITGVYEALKPLLSAWDYETLGNMVELCPTHGCDVQICRDDKASCQDEA